MTEENVLNNDNADGAGQSRAVGLFLLKRYNEAAAVYDDLLRQAPDNIAFWVNKMICVLQYSEPDAAFSMICCSRSVVCRRRGIYVWPMFCIIWNAMRKHWFLSIKRWNRNLIMLTPAC